MFTHMHEDPCPPACCCYACVASAEDTLPVEESLLAECKSAWDECVSLYELLLTDPGNAHLQFKYVLATARFNELEAKSEALDAGTETFEL